MHNDYHVIDDTNQIFMSMLHTAVTYHNYPDVSRHFSSTLSTQAWKGRPKFATVIP